MNMGAENGCVNGGHCYMNSPTGSESKNHNSIDSTKKRYKIDPNKSEMENNGLQGGVGIDVMLPVSTLNRNSNMKFNTENHKLLTNGKISTSNFSSVSTLTSPSIASTN